MPTDSNPLLLRARTALFLVSWVLFTGACGPGADAVDGSNGEAPSGATLYHGGDIITMEGEQPAYVCLLYTSDAADDN